MIGRSINPTTLTVGKTGLLDHHRATVVGRAVLQSAEGYRWHEYYVELDTGRMIILVYEAGAWKRFDEFTPDPPMTAKEAEGYGIGASLELHGKRAAVVKYLSTSRVVYSEGKTWDGVRAGSAAQYFNAESDGEMIVVSWTGDEIEFFVGRKISRYLVAQAFKLPEPSFWRKLVSGGSGSFEMGGENSPAMYFIFGAILLLGAVMVIVTSADDSPMIVDPPPVAPAPTVELVPGDQGTLAGEHFVVRARKLVEVDEPNARFKRFEYALIDDHGDEALLVQDLTGNPHEWVLFRPEAAPGWLMPTAAATFRQGMTLRLVGTEAKVQRLFLSRSLDIAGPAISPPPTTTYGFLARSGDAWILARWTEQTLDLERGQSVPEATVLTASPAGTK